MMVEPPMLLPLQDFPRNLGQQSGCSLPGSLWWLCMFQAETWGSGWCCLNFLLKHLTFLRLLWCSVYNARLIYCLMPRNKNGLWAASMDKNGLFLFEGCCGTGPLWIVACFSAISEHGPSSPVTLGRVPQHMVMEPSALFSMNQVDPALGHWHGSWSI